MKRRQKPILIASKEPCVHCGAPYNRLCCHGNARPDGTAFDLSYQVMCERCRATGPAAKTAQEAVKGWEHRAAPRLDDPLPMEEAETELEFDDEVLSDILTPRKGAV